jgi:hypothetical protein
MRAITYLIYIIFWELLTIGGSAYIVFVLDRSAWWMLLGVFMAGLAYRPQMWMDGKSFSKCVKS